MHKEESIGVELARAVGEIPEKCSNYKVIVGTVY